MNKIINVIGIFGIMNLVACGGGGDFTTTSNTAKNCGKGTIYNGTECVVDAGGSGGKNSVGGTAGLVVGSSGTVSKGGAAGQQVADPTNPNCRPKTCATIAAELGKGDLNLVACGSVADGCGGYVDCGNCSSVGVGSICGAPSMTSQLDQYGQPVFNEIANKNLCGGTCIFYQSTSYNCNSAPANMKYMLFCPYPSDNGAALEKMHPTCKYIAESYMCCSTNQ